MSRSENKPLNPVALYEQLPLDQQKCLDEINFLASELRDHLLPEQFMLAINAINQRLQEMHPQIPCPGGCSRCCENFFDTVSTTTERQWVKSALNALSTEVHTQIQEQLQKKHRGMSSRCPLLIEGQCSVYSVRPLDCRLQGYSLNKAQPFTCQEEQLRMSHELEQQKNPLGYMFMPQRDRLKDVFDTVVSQKSPQEMLSVRLHAHFSQHAQ